MRIFSLDNKLDTITIGIIGTESQGEEIKSRILSMCDEMLRDKVVFLVPHNGVSPETMISGAGRACREKGLSSGSIWLCCSLPQLFPADVVWPSGIFFVTDFLDRNEAFFNELKFVPKFIAVNDLAILVSETLRREADAENTDMEIARLRSEKFRLNKRADDLEKAVLNAGRTVEKINEVWRKRTIGIKTLFVILFILSSLLLAWTAYGVWNPSIACKTLVTTHMRIFGDVPDMKNFFAAVSPLETLENKGPAPGSMPKNEGVKNEPVLQDRHDEPDGDAGEDSEPSLFVTEEERIRDEKDGNGAEKENKDAPEAKD